MNNVVFREVMESAPSMGIHCEVTDKLDTCIKGPSYKNYKTYLYDFEEMVDGGHLFAIRLPGRTVGDLIIDKDNIVTEVKIGQDCLGHHFNEDVNDIAKEYIGAKVIIPSEIALRGSRNIK